MKEKTQIPKIYNNQNSNQNNNNNQHYKDNNNELYNIHNKITPTTTPTITSIQNPEPQQSNNTQNFKPIWKIATFNIQGFSTDTSKRQTWFDFCLDNNFDIIITTETNGNSNLSKYWNYPPYINFWTHTMTQSLGQGLGISLNPHIAKRVYKIKKHSGREFQ